jgi:hypothetical protein
MFRWDWIDPRNKAYGLNYTNVSARPSYERDSVLALCTLEKMKADQASMIQVLEQWKARQGVPKPLMYLVSVSGGGTRSATFTFHVLRRADSLLGGDLMKKTFLITGASGGMLGAGYYRELYRNQQLGKRVDIQSDKHVEAISGDLLNPLFSSMVTRDIFAPAQKFKVGPYAYIKDRGYAFEQQLSLNTGGILNQRLAEYKDDESNARIPLMFFNSTITSDGRKMTISTQPVSFMMRNWPDSSSGVLGEPDAIDFGAFFHRQDPQNLRLLSAMRINATFPYVLPNVWLPSTPVVDLMDAGIRDNYGQETALRFLQVFNDWLKENTAGVVLIQIRDRKPSEWEPTIRQEGLSGLFAKPLTVIQMNWMKIQDYYHEEMVSLSNDRFDFPFEKLSFSYYPTGSAKGAALNFHLTNKEKRDIHEALYNEGNQLRFRRLSLVHHPDSLIIHRNRASLMD